jgi:GTP-binding protein
MNGESMETKGRAYDCKIHIPSRGIIGLRNQLLTAGEAIMAHRFIGYALQRRNCWT